MSNETFLPVFDGGQGFCVKPTVSILDGTNNQLTQIKQGINKRNAQMHELGRMTLQLIQKKRLVEKAIKKNNVGTEQLRQIAHQKYSILRQRIIEINGEIRGIVNLIMQ